MRTPSPRVHDLLEIDGPSLMASLPSPPAWLRDRLGEHSYTVVRRVAVTANHVPVGISGALRHQRLAAFISRELVKRTVTPPQLRQIARPTLYDLPAERSLDSLEKRWEGLRLVWGPIGSVALELATGSRMANANSDLDIVLYAEDRFPAEEARVILTCTLGLPAKVDVLVETPFCGFSLSEFGRAGSSKILLRTPQGPVLASDPWDAHLLVAGTTRSSMLS